MPGCREHIGDYTRVAMSRNKLHTFNFNSYLVPFTLGKVQMVTTPVILAGQERTNPKMVFAHESKYAVHQKLSLRLLCYGE